jgi:hypothetical protein
LSRLRPLADAAAFLLRWLVSAAGAVALAAGLGACDQECCTIDSLPIPVTRAPLGDGAGSGALLALAAAPGGGASFRMVVDTASPITILSGAPPNGSLTPTSHAFDLLDATAAVNPVPVRARFRNIGLFTLPLGAAGDAATLPGGVLGGDLLRVFSVELRFAGPCPGAMPGAAGPGCSSVTFWRHQGASLAFLEDAGYAVLRFALFGGGETTAVSGTDTFGVTSPINLPPTRVVLRACGAPDTFVPTVPPDPCCTHGAEISAAKGVDLSLLLATGTGPLVLSRAAWTRLAANLPAPPAMTSASLLIATWPRAIPAAWTSIPRLALVDGGEPPATGDEGPCVDLGRSRRIEWVARQQAASAAAGSDTSACVQLCDTNPGTNEALNSAAYLELGGAIPVAVIDDAEPFLQSLRFDIRPEGPEVDGLLGAGALGSARLELDYLGDQPRAIFSCEPGVTPDSCYAAARCPHLPDHDQKHLCFGLSSHGLPLTCAPSGC